MRFTILVLVVQSVTSISNQICFNENSINQQKIKIKKILHDEIVELLRAGIDQRGKHLMLLYNIILLIYYRIMLLYVIILFP